MKFGQYELLGRIAVGGMAEIYRGRAVGEEGFEKPVAIKRILPQFARDARFVSMLVTEARIHAQLSHRNIVQIHDLGVSEEGEYFIVLEFVDGPDLAALLEALRTFPTPSGRGLRLSDAVALYVAIELGEGIHFAHELRGADGQPLGLIHRDISPSNVLISYAGEVKLSDFGLAKRRTDHSVVGSLKGKLAYMSPEQARRVPLDRRSDIFALGAVLFEMLTGRRLREVGDDLGGWQQVATGAVPSPRAIRADLPAPLERLLVGALTADPRERFPDGRTFVAAARAALDEVPRGRVSEAVELQELLKRVLPLGAPRARAEQSKVIRLVSEFLPNPSLAAAVAAAARGAPGAARSIPPLDPRDEAGPDDPTRIAPTPHPQGHGQRPRPAAPPGAQPTPLPPRRGTPSLPVPLTKPRATPSAGLPTARTTPAPARPAAAARPPAPPASPPAPPASSPAPAAASAGPPARPAPEGGGRLPGGRGKGTGGAGAGGPEGGPAPGPGLPSAAGLPAGLPAFLAGAPPPPKPPAPPRRRALPAVGALLAVAGLAAATVHFKVVPLDVLAVWTRPVRLELTSQPPTAEIYVDGTRLPRRTPTTIELPRDRSPHEIEMRRDGFRPARTTVRLDRSAADALPVGLVLEKETRPAVRPLPGVRPDPRRGR